MKKMKNYLFVAENNQFTAPFFQIPQKKGYILGLHINGKTIIKCESDFNRLCIEADEVRQLM